MEDFHPQLLRDALEVLDRYRVPLANRDPSRSLNENREELLLRVRAALERVRFNGLGLRDDVAEISRKIDEALRAGRTNTPRPDCVTRTEA